MKKLLLIIFGLLLFSCEKKVGDTSEKATDKEACATDSTLNKDGFEMYEMSEMAALMEQMYVDNERLKERIVKGDTIGKFPQHFIKIHKAVMTDETDKDAFFNEQAAKEHFNNGIDACIKCHEVKCGGPIPKIKKLYIK